MVAMIVQGSLSVLFSCLACSVAVQIATDGKGEDTVMVSIHSGAKVELSHSSAHSIVRSEKRESNDAKEGELLSIKEASAPRRVYVDLGVNWANTLRLFEDIGAKRSEAPWDVYGFEASPLIQPYVEKFVGWLNGENSKPPVLVPPSGSSEHLDIFAPRYGCPTCQTKNCDVMRDCMFKRFQKELSLLKPDPALASDDLIQSRLNIAKTSIGNSNRFTAVPAAVGDHNGMLNLGMVTPEQMIRGGAHDESTGNVMSVAMVDFPTWLVTNFAKDDYIIVKMDIEGGEFGILNNLLSGPHACLIDVLAMECHPIAGDCAALKQRLRENSCMSVMYEDEGYKGEDHYSTPDKYYPEDP